MVHCYTPQKNRFTLLIIKIDLEFILYNEKNQETMSIAGIPQASLDSMLLLLDLMYEYQKPRNINSLCITNAQTFYDMVINSKLCPPNKVSVKAVMVAGVNERDTLVFVPNHMVVFVGDKILDPSYNTSCLKDSIYTDNLATLFSKFSKKNFKNYDLRNSLDLFVRMKEWETKMNNNEFVITDKTYYNDQLDYLVLRGAIIDIGTGFLS